MSLPGPSPAADDPVERLVRDYLDRSAATVDAAAMLVRVRAAQMSQPAPKPSRWWQRHRVSLAFLATAAALLIAFVLGGGPEPQPVTAAQLIREAQQTHATASDHCYEVVAEWNPGAFNRTKLPPVTRTSRLWTRGDQFWISTALPGRPPLAWGQDRDGRVWATANPSRGFIYEPEELGAPLSRYCDLLSLRLVTTLGELLQRYDLYRRDSGQPGEPIRIEATFRPMPGRPPPRYSHVVLEIDPETKIIQSAELERRFHGHPVGKLKFRLVETSQLPDDQYTLAGHLNPDAIVIDREAARQGSTDFRIRTREEVLKWLQFQAGAGLPPRK